MSQNIPLSKISEYKKGTILVLRNFEENDGDDVFIQPKALVIARAFITNEDVPMYTCLYSNIQNKLCWKIGGNYLYGSGKGIENSWKSIKSYDELTKEESGKVDKLLILEALKK